MAKLKKVTVFFDSDEVMREEDLHFKDLADQLGFEEVDLMIDKRRRDPIFILKKGKSNLSVVISLVISGVALLIGLATMLL